MTRRSSPPPPGQYDLFGEDEAAEQKTAEAAKTRAEIQAAWEAQFERVEIPAPWRGEDAVVLGWKCPACGTIESSEFLLGNNHGYHPDQPGWVPYRGTFGETCVKLELQAAHRVYDERRAMIRHLCAAGLGDEEISVRLGGNWPASVIAGYRQDDAKTARLAAKAAKGETVTVGHGSGCPCAFCDGPCNCPSCESFRGNR